MSGKYCIVGVACATPSLPEHTNILPYFHCWSHHKKHNKICLALWPHQLWERFSVHDAPTCYLIMLVFPFVSFTDQLCNAQTVCIITSLFLDFFFRTPMIPPSNRHLLHHLMFMSSSNSKESRFLMAWSWSIYYILFCICNLLNLFTLHEHQPGLVSLES